MDTKQRKQPRSSVDTASGRRTAASDRVPQRKAAPSQKRPAQRKRTQTAPKKQEPQTPKITPDVVYLPPKPFNRNRLILHLATIAAVVIAVMLGLSVFFKVDKIEISGAEKYSAWDIENASGIKVGDNLLTFSRAKAAGRIKDSLEYVKTIRIGIKLPDTVKIEVVEVAVTYAVKDQTGAQWLISAEGRVIEQKPADLKKEPTQITGITLQNPQAGQQAVAAEDSHPQTDENGEPIPVTVTAADRLKTALDIAQYLELNDIFGQVSVLDVSDLMDITLTYGQSLHVRLGGTDQLSYKISVLRAAAAQVGEEGTLDIRDPGKIIFKEPGE